MPPPDSGTPAATSNEAAPDPAGDHDRAHWTTGPAAVRAAVVVLWLAGLVVGFVAILVVAARATCASGSGGSGGSGGLACGTAGTLLGVLLVAATVSVVGVSTVTVTEARSQPRMWLTRWAVSLAVLALLLVASRLVLGTL